MTCAIFTRTIEKFNAYFRILEYDITNTMNIKGKIVYF